MSLMEKRENSYTISTLFAFFHKVPGGVRCHWPLSFIPIGNGKLASAGEPPRFSIVAALLSVQPSASGGQCGFMTIGYTSPLLELREWRRHGRRGGAEAERHGTRGRQPDFYCWGLTPLSGESNGTSFSSKAPLSIADLEEKEKLSALFIMGWEEVGKNRLTAMLFTKC